MRNGNIINIPVNKNNTNNKYTIPIDNHLGIYLLHHWINTSIATDISNPANIRYKRARLLNARYPA